MSLIGLTVIAGIIQGTVSTFKQKRQTPKRLVDHLQDSQKMQRRLLPQGSSEERWINQNLTLSVGLAGLTGIGRLGHPLLLLCSLPGLLYLNLSFFFKGYQELIKERKIGIGLIDAIVTIGMFILQSFFANALFLVLYFTSRKLLYRIHNNAEQLFFEQPHKMVDSAWLLQNETETKISLAQVEVGDIVVVNDDEFIPVDGVIIEGQAMIRQPFLAREQLIEKGVGESVLASTAVINGRICIRVEQASHETLVAEINRILNREPHTASSEQLEGEQTIDKGTLPLLAAGAMTLRLLDLRRAIAVLLTNFGNDYRVVLPISYLSYLQTALKEGILVKDGLSLERLQRIDSLIFKGITDLERKQLTGNLQKHNITVHDGNDKDEAELYALIQGLQLAGSVVGFAYREQYRTENTRQFTDVMDQADISILMCERSTMSIESSKIVLLGGQVEQLLYLFELAQSLNVNTRRSLFITLAPCILCLGGVYFYHFGLFTSLILDHLGLVGGLTNAMAPRLHHANSLPRSTEPHQS